MTFTREKVAEIKAIIREVIVELFVEDDFLQKLSDRLIEKTLSADSGGVIGTASVIVEKQNFRISELEKDNRSLRRQVDRAEQYSRRKQLRVIGLQESEKENLCEKLQLMFRDDMKLDASVSLQECHRIGRVKGRDVAAASAGGGSEVRSTKPKPRHVLLKLLNIEQKRLIIRSRKHLKNSGIIVVEDLTRERYGVFRAAQEKFGRRAVWTSDGAVFARIAGKKVSIGGYDDLENAGAK